MRLTGSRKRNSEINELPPGRCDSWPDMWRTVNRNACPQEAGHAHRRPEGIIRFRPGLQEAGHAAFRR